MDALVPFLQLTKSRKGELKHPYITTNLRFGNVQCIHIDNKPYSCPHSSSYTKNNLRISVSQRKNIIIKNYKNSSYIPNRLFLNREQHTAVKNDANWHCSTDWHKQLFSQCNQGYRFRNLDFWIRGIFAGGIGNPGKGCMWNPESWALESGIQLKESGIPLRVEQNPDSTDKRL